MKRKISGTAKVKDGTRWIYAGHTFNIVERRDASKIEVELGLGSEYKLSLIGTEFESRYPTFPYTFIHGVDLEVVEDENQLDDELINRVIEQIKKDVNAGDLIALSWLLNNHPRIGLIGYIPRDDREHFQSLIK